MTLRTLAYPIIALMLALILAGGTAFAKDDSSTRKLASGANTTTVSISGDGNVLVRGAEVTGVASGSITAKTVWSGTTLTWTLDTDSDTSYLGANGQSVARAEIETGDTVSFSGKIDGSLSVEADVIRTWEVSEEDDDRTHITGTVTSVSSGSFVIDSGNRRVTVDVGSDTDFIVGKDTDASLADLTAGTKVRVEGSFSDDDFDASSVTSIALNAKGGKSWHGVFDFFKDFKFDWR